MNVLMIGDVVGHTGCDHLRRVLPAVKRQYAVDITIVNGENSADGNGILPVSARHIMDSGADVITGGNHTFRRPEAVNLLEQNACVLRPANYPPGTPGHGIYTVDKGRFRLTVINLMGTAYLENLPCPFAALDALLAQEHAPACLVDFHAEATAEKQALAYYADGRISALIGTHTHVQTADPQILPGGTGYLTDVGMTGPIHSVLGVKPELSIQKMRTKLPVRFATADGPCRMDGVLLTINNTTGKTEAISTIRIE